MAGTALLVGGSHMHLKESRARSASHLLQNRAPEPSGERPIPLGTHARVPAQWRAKPSQPSLQGSSRKYAT